MEKNLSWIRSAESPPLRITVQYQEAYLASLVMLSIDPHEGMMGFSICTSHSWKIRKVYHTKMYLIYCTQNGQNSMGVLAILSAIGLNIYNNCQTNSLTDQILMLPDIIGMLRLRRLSC